MNYSDFALRVNISTERSDGVNHFHRMIRFLVLVSLIFLFIEPVSHGAVKTYHTDAGVTWTCGSAAPGMTGVLTDSPAYNCISDYILISNTQFETIGTWVSPTPNAEETRIAGQQLYLYAVEPGTMDMNIVVEIGYTVDAIQFTPFGYSFKDHIQTTGEYILDITQISGIIPQNTYLYLRLYGWENYGFGGAIIFGNDIDSTGYIRFVLDEVPNFATMSPSSYDFKDIFVGDTVTTSFSVRSELLTGMLDVSQVTATGTDMNQYAVVNDSCTGSSLSLAATCTFDVAFSPTSEGFKDARAEISFSTPGTIPIKIPLSGYGIPKPAASVSPSRYDFVDVFIGETATASFSVRSDLSTGVLGIASVTGPSLNFFDISVVNDNCTGTSFSLNETCTFDLEFRPTNTFSFSVGNGVEITFTNSGIMPISIPLSAAVSSTPPITVSPAQYAFNDVLVGETGTASFSVRSDRQVRLLDLSQVTVTGTDLDQFAVVNDNCSGSSLSPNATCTFGVEFRPTLEGSKASDVKISVGYPGTTPFIIPLSGVALPNTPPTVSSVDDQNVYWNEPVVVDFTISDAETASSDLQVTITSDNQTLFPDPINTPGSTNISWVKSGSNLTLSLIPISDRWGTAVLTVTVSDGVYSTVMTFTMEITRVWRVGLSGGDITSIQAAIDATTTVDGDVILIADGVYKRAGNKNIDFKGKAITVKSQNGPEQTIIDCEFSGRGFISNQSKVPVIDGLTIRNCVAPTDSGDVNIDGKGGAILIRGSQGMIIKNSIFNNNRAAKDGGAIYGIAKLINSTFLYNYAGENGGAINSSSASTAVSNSRYSNCRFIDNRAGKSGGAIYVAASPSQGTTYGITIETSLFQGNRADKGGAIGGVAIKVDRSVFRDNTAADGGAISASSYLLDIINSITSSFFHGNKALKRGGALFADKTFKVLNSTFSGNQAFEEGSAIYFDDSSTYSSGNPPPSSIVNSIIWGKAPVNTGHLIYYETDKYLGELQLGNSDIEGGMGAVLNYDNPSTTYADTTVKIIGNILNIDPKFIIPDDYHLMPDSPLIDEGMMGGLPATDIEGNELPDGDAYSFGTVDIGAYEFNKQNQNPVAVISSTFFNFTSLEGGPLSDSQTLSILNGGFGTLHWEIREDIPWLSAEPTKGTTSDEIDKITLYVDFNSLTYGNHIANFSIIDPSITDPNISNILREVTITINIAKIHHVQAGSKIQEAIDSAIDGDVVLVASGSYTGQGNINLDFRGKEITVRSENGPDFTFIDCGDIAGSGGVFFRSGESATSILDGFTIRKCSGGIWVGPGSSPTIINTIFSNNNFNDWPTTQYAHGVYIEGSSTTLRNCKFRDNTGGDGIRIMGSFNRIENCTFYGENITIWGDHNSIISSKFINSLSISVDYVDFWRGTDTQIIGSTFTGAIGKAIYMHGTASNLTIANSIFSKNTYGIYSQSPSLKYEVINSTFSGNEWAIRNQTVDAKITNSILWGNTKAFYLSDTIHTMIPLSVNYSNIQSSSSSSYSGTKNMMVDPQFVDPDGPDNIAGNEDDDFRLLSTSPVIDQGTTIPWLFSDIRGSIRPVDGDGDGKAKFDLGAYEYSEYYGGFPEDLPAKVFQDVRINGSLVVVGYEYKIEWKDREPFPFDPRVKQAGEYTVNIALVNDYGLRIVLGTYTVDISQQGYSIPFTFLPEHIGEWRIRVEVASDPNQYEESEIIEIQYKTATRYALSQWIKPPTGADPTVRPDVGNPEAVYWSVETNRLYAIRPVTTVVTWYSDAQKTIPYPVVAVITYPDLSNTIFHVADSMPVDLMPAGTRFDLAEIQWTSGDATVSGNLMRASKEGWSVILYRDNQDVNPDTKEKFDVIRTLTWNHPDADDAFDSLDIGFPISEESPDIGKSLSPYAGHNITKCGSGYVFFENSYYDGSGQNRAYDRTARTGPIIPVNKDLTGPIDDQTDPLDDLVVVWYQKSSSSEVCWPSKPVRYSPVWPATAKKIVIASQLGSGPLNPAQFGLLEDMVVYNQPDRTLPGYNPNEEHAGFFTAQGSEYPAVFPLRSDLNRSDTSEPYVLLKYQDPVTGEWRFEVYQVLDQSGKFVVQNGQVVSDIGNTTRYYIDGAGDLVIRSGYLPDVSYYIDANGHLINPADTTPSCYNYDGVNSITLVSCSGVKIHSFGQNGQLQAALGPYYLDVHGVLVESDVYYRLHYEGVAGNEINPPYPLNQLAFGPCKESYINEDSVKHVLKDKDDKMFARSGGINGEPAQDISLHYSYRLQTGFFLDFGGDGFTDIPVGACIPWLAWLVETPDKNTPPQSGTSVKTAYAISWPDPVPTLFVGETLTDAKTQAGEAVGLPNVKDQCVADILFDQSVEESGDPSAKLAKLIDPLFEYAAPYATLDPESELPQVLKPERGNSGRWVFTALPEHIQSRLTYDPYSGVAGELKFKGSYQTGTGEAMLLLNWLTDWEMKQIAHVFDPDATDAQLESCIPPGICVPIFDIDPNFKAALYNLRSQGDLDLQGYTSLKFADIKALTAGDAQGTGYVTLAFNNDEDCPAPTMLSVIRVDCPLYTGEVKVIESPNVFEEKVTLRHNGDFGGDADDRWFQWQYLPGDFSGIPEGPDSASESLLWNPYSAITPEALPPRSGDPGYPFNTTEDPYSQGAVDITVQGSGQQLLADKWFSTRYYYDGVCGPLNNTTDPGNISAWTKPQLYEGWIKRVMKKINLFDQKVKDFHEAAPDTLASMISLAGQRYEGDVPLTDDPDTLNNLGIIEVYETLLNRGEELSIDGTPQIDDGSMNMALLFAASRISDLNMLLGNEAFADAADPTIGFSTSDGQYGIEAPSIFSFQNQTASLLDEELTLLRGRDDYGVRPFYNRLIWNFTLGDGEVAYKENYNITDQITEDTDNDTFPDVPDGQIDEKDAMVLYPQGHGDAWGHYLSATKTYYKLLTHRKFTWIPRSEAILVGQTPVEVDYMDERKFASAAAAKARTGAEIVNLTYRQYYTEDPEGQWQGYKDTDANHRAWGLSEWASRAGQGAFFDWVVGNAILPPTSNNEGIEKVDRTTVLELSEISSQYNVIQAKVDEADAGLNPLGLAKDVVPFDIDPGQVANGETHFEQIYGRAVQAMNNAIAVFNHANQSTQLLRHQQNSLSDFQRNIENSDADFNNRLIEIFGYPYPDDCGSGKTYPTGYCETGPDLYHFMYVDPSEHMGVEAPKVHYWVQTFKSIDVDDNGALTKTDVPVTFHVATDGRFGLIKPPEWLTRRKAPGEVQLARSDLLQTRIRLEKAIDEYDNLLDNIESQAKLIELQHGVNKEEIMILDRSKASQEGLNNKIKNARVRELLYRHLAGVAVPIANASAEIWPKTVGVIVGLANGVITDPLAPVRGAAMLIGTAIQEIFSTIADNQSMAQLSHQQAKEIESAETNIELTALRSGFAIEQQLLQLESLVRSEATLRDEIYVLVESLHQSAGRYQSALARGERLLADRLRFRKQTAVQIVDYRYKDMTFRIFRNDALQKYRAQFDMAGRYAYLAAKAYDYETALLDYNSMAGQAFLTDIVRQRTIGMIQDGQPLTGSGLADPMKRMWQNFQVLKPQLGFNNPQQETNRFSLRQELLRIKMDWGSNDTWRNALSARKVDNLWDIPEFKRYLRPFGREGVREPAIVIPFDTTVTSGLNFYGWPLGGGDSYYSSSNFATKIRSLGVWFSNYNSVGLAQTPRIYLVPVGQDILRTPSYGTNEIRTWHVVDQKLPIPFPINTTEMANDVNWIPTVNTLFDEMFQIRRHSDFRAYHDSGYINQSEMQYDSRLIGRSVWNNQWLLIIPGRSLLYDPDEGLETFIHGPEAFGGLGERTGNGISDIKLFFETYSYSGN